MRLQGFYYHVFCTYSEVTDRDHVRKLMLQAAQEKDGDLTRSDVMNLLGIEAMQAYRLLRSLADVGFLVLRGSGRTARHVLPEK